MIAELALTTLIGGIKGWVKKMKGFDAIIKESNQMFGVLEPSLNDLYGSENIDANDSVHAMLNSIQEALLSYNHTIKKIYKRPLVARYIKTERYSGHLSEQIGVIKNIIPMFI